MCENLHAQCAVRHRNSVRCTWSQFASTRRCRFSAQISTVVITMRSTFSAWSLFFSSFFIEAMITFSFQWEFSAHKCVIAQLLLFAIALAVQRTTNANEKYSAINFVSWFFRSGVAGVYTFYCLLKSTTTAKRYKNDGSRADMYFLFRHFKHFMQ